MYTPAIGIFLATLSSVGAQYTATYLPDTAPDTTEQGQTGTNKCGTTSSQDSMCQNVYINAVDDFCLWAPPTPSADSGIGATESGYGTCVIPKGTITGAHFVQTPDFVQVTGTGDLTKLDIPAGDTGGELDPHGADGNGNPIGGLVFSTAFGKLGQVFEWMNFMSSNEFCFRACNPSGKMAPVYCVFESCRGDSGEPLGVYGTSTFHQGDASTPAPHPIPSSSQRTAISAIGGGTAGMLATATMTSSSSGTASTSTSTSATAMSAGKATNESGEKNGGVVALGQSVLGGVGGIVGGFRRVRAVTTLWMKSLNTTDSSLSIGVKYIILCEFILISLHALVPNLPQQTLALKA
ncbi:uncharacterized protein ARMOST_21768 [Armillaria ostoyae]|uniref:Uncharacterized protein n=1 Tax=Armillaria ostoyae TaxID=47428 RepID=A0A284SAZ7_ARMOS|nr:uncharacterized protein ARMOST_21768 [Armillaria ostoyae]